MRRVEQILPAAVLVLLFPFSVGAQPKSWKLVCAPAGADGAQSLVGIRYDDGQHEFGFDLTKQPQIIDGRCTAPLPFFVSVKEPDGDYRVTIILGGGQAGGSTSVKAEARRLMVWNAATRPNRTVKRRFVVHVRTPLVNASEKVHLKPRELGNLDWDKKLTLEFTGDHPSVRRIEIQPARVPTIYLAGDSTVVDQDWEPWAAWGQMLPAFFNAKVAVANEAESGETIASFASERRFDKIFSTIRAGDYLLMQFAHNDQKTGRGFVSIPEYKELLRRYIAIARQRKAHPILVTSMNRRRFSTEARIVATLGEYPDAMREVAREEDVPLIDLNAMSRTLFEAMGPDGTLKAFVHYPANMFPGQSEDLKDDTHFNSYGALELAKCVVQAIREQNLPLAKYLNADFPGFDPAHPDSPSIWKLPLDPFWSLQKPDER